MMADATNPPPQEFQDLKVVRIRPKDSNIMVEGCFDEYVYLRFFGVNKAIEEKRIELQYPTHSDIPHEQATETLWAR